MERVAELENILDGIGNGKLLALIENIESSAWLYLLLSALNIFLMQAGFALLEVGTVQAKNAKSILFKNTLDATVSMMVWWTIGFGIAGSGASGQQGRHFFDIHQESSLSFVHSYVFAGTTATIVSGGVAERMNFSAYVLFSIFLVGLVYPVLVCWGYGEEGWLATFGYKDFAGAGIIHLCGGSAALMGAILVGPRIGRFKTEDGVVEIINMKGHSPVLSNLGTFILLFGWLSFNGSSVLGGDLQSLTIACRAVLNTLLSCSASAISSFVFHSCWPSKNGQPRTHNLEDLNNSILAGAVSITGACAFVEGWAAIITGIIGFFVYTMMSNTILMYHVDDPLDAAAVHGGCGLWGVLAVAFFTSPKFNDGQGGVIYGQSNLIGSQIVGALTIAGWTLGMSFVLYKLIDQIPGFQLRVDKDAELLGLDFAYHDGFAYQGLTPESISYHNELKAAERRVEARNKGATFERKKVKDLKQRRKKKIFVNGYEVEVTDSTGNTPPTSNTFVSPFRKLRKTATTANRTEENSPQHSTESKKQRSIHSIYDNYVDENGIEKAPSSTSSYKTNEELHLNSALQLGLIDEKTDEENSGTYHCQEQQ